jgi:Domain of unknown function (DUF4331)
MKYKNILKLKSIALLFVTAAAFTSCDKSPVVPPVADTYELADQMARPAINTVFVSTAEKDLFNTTIPSQMASVFGAKFKARLLALNPAYTTNALGMNADVFSGALVTDVLTVSKTGVTTFFDGSNVLTGRALADDVIDTELLLIFGGPTGASNPSLTSDKVNTNDKTFLTSFPYLATPH